MVGILVALLLVLAAYFSDRHGGIDEIGLFNPTYMALHYGKMTYPVHGYFDAMVVHPPVHYEAIAILMRLGLSLYYAQATPALLMLFLCIWLIVRGPFTGPVKIGLLYGIWVSVAIFGKIGIEMFGMRPENHLGAAWLAGLVALESARLEKWNLKLLCGGTFLLTYASGIHYYAAVGILGVGVYMAWVVKSFGLRGARRPLLAMTLGGLLCGVPYLLLFYLPHHTAIQQMIHGTQAGGSIADNLRAHFDEYRRWVAPRVGNFWLRGPVSVGIPLVILSTPILLAIPSTRGIALAALPLQLFILLFAWHKHTYYYIHEVELYSAAVVAGVLTAADRLVPRLRWRWAQYPVWAILAVALGLGWWHLDKWGGKLAVSMEPRVHESEIARAAGREMVGPDARVASRIGAWYSAGAESWYNPSPDVLFPLSLAGFDGAAYFSRFDAVAEYSHMSDATSNRERKALLSWYLDGTLQLRGFFFAEHIGELSYLLLQTGRSSPLTGFALKQGQLHRFTASDDGAYEMVVVASPLTGRVYDFLNRVPYSNLMYLPKLNDADPQSAAVVALFPRLSGEVALPEGRVVQQSRGNLLPADWRAMVDEMRREDLPIRFSNRLEALAEARQATLAYGLPRGAKLRN